MNLVLNLILNLILGQRGLLVSSGFFLYVISQVVFSQDIAETTRQVPSTSNARLDINVNFCETEPNTQLCSVLPQDITDFSSSFVYMTIEPTAQNPFDLFSWKSFVALNWPTDSGETDDFLSIGDAPSSARAWQHYEGPNELFGLNTMTACKENLEALEEGNSMLKLAEYLQASGQPLIDQSGNYVIYDVRVNDALGHYIEQNQLDTLVGQRTFKESGQEIEFPLGYYDNIETKLGGSVGAIELKTAWRILDPLIDDTSRYFVRDALIALEASAVESGEARCFDVQVGLVGMHIVQRTRSGNGGDWIWSTFEHVDNAPMADNARGPNSIFARTLFPDGCQAEKMAARTWSFHSGQCRDCETNSIDLPKSVSSTGVVWKWSEEMPFAGSMIAKGVSPPQVVRCCRPSLGTRAINEVWQEKLRGTIWANYELLTTQWKGANRDLMFPSGEVPRYLTNTTMETYIQDAQDGTCLGCHSHAVTAAGQSANFSFLLGQVRR